jgi:hypothetical protein
MDLAISGNGGATVDLFRTPFIISITENFVNKSKLSVVKYCMTMQLNPQPEKDPG